MAISSVSSDLTQDAIDRYLAQPEGNCLAFREGQWQVIQGSQAKAGVLEGLFSSSKTSMRPFESTHLCFEKASLEKIDIIFISAVQSTCETLREDINRGKQEIDRNEDTIGLYQKANKKMQSFQKRVHSLHDSLLKDECTMLFDSMKIIFETRVRDFFFSKIESQDLEGITELLTIGNFTSDDIHNAFKVAVDRGYSEVIELLLEKGHISSEYIEAAFKTVYSRQDRLDSLKVFLKSGLIDSQLKEKAMRYAAAQNFIDHMQFFLEDRTFCEYALDQPLKTAIAKGYVEIVKLILGTRSGQNKLKEKGFSQLLVEKAIESGKIEIIDYLLQDRTILINPADTKKLLQIAIDSNAAQTVGILLEGASEDLIQGCLRQALRKGNLKIFQMLLHKATSPSTIKEAFFEACIDGSENFVKAILDKSDFKDSLDSTSWQKAFTLSANYGRANLLAILLTAGIANKLGENFTSLVSKAFASAVVDKHASIIAILLPLTSSITQEQRNKAIVLASKSNNLNLVKALLEKGPISREARLTALKIAVKARENLDMIMTLVSEHIDLVKEVVADPSQIDNSNKQAIYKLILENADPSIPQEFLRLLQEHRNPKIQDHLMSLFVQKTPEELNTIIGRLGANPKTEYSLFTLLIDSFNVTIDIKTEILKKILTLHKQLFKDFPKRDILLKTLYHLQQNSNPDHFSLLNKLLDLLVTQGVGKAEKLTAFLHFTSIATISPSLLSKITAETLSAESLANLIIDDLKTHELLPADFSSTDAMQIFSRLRNPGAFFTYLQKFKNDAKLKPSLQRFILGLLNGTFLTDRNERNSHKTHLSDAQLTAWQTAHTVVDSSIVDSDDPMDLFLCGTEIAGSCQSVHEAPQFCKCLMGYVIDGKVRILAKKTDDGKIFSRAILKIALTENSQPALFLERSYGGDADTKAKIKTMALSKAAQMGIPLFEKYVEPQDSASQPQTEVVTLTSKGNAAPFEYEDGLLPHGVTEGKYSVKSIRISE